MSETSTFLEPCAFAARALRAWRLSARSRGCWKTRQRRGCKQGEASPFYYICCMPFFTKSNLVDLRAEAEQLSICVEHFLYASERVVEGDYKTKGFYDNCIEKCNGRLKAIHFLMESIRQNRPVSEEELEETLPDFLNCQKNAKDKK